MYKEINVVFKSANTTSIQKPVGQGVILSLTTELKNTSCEAIAAIDGDSSDRSGQSKLKT